MSAPACDLLHDLLPEFALGLLDGEERAAVLDHLSGCPACRSEAARLSATADAVSVAAPGVEPPAGFEDRVLARLHAASPGGSPDGLAERRRSRRFVLALAAAVVLVAVIAAGSALVVDRHNTRVRAALPTRSEEMRTPSGRVVGQLTVTGRPAAVLISAPGWQAAAGRTYRMRVGLTDGRSIDYGVIDLDDGYGGYGLVGVQVAEVRRVEMLTTSGRVACSAVFS